MPSDDPASTSIPTRLSLDVYTLSSHHKMALEGRALLAFITCESLAVPAFPLLFADLDFAPRS